MIQIKETKSVKMLGDEKSILIDILGQKTTIPIKTVFQVKRGLESYIQRFYRKTSKK